MRSLWVEAAVKNVDWRLEGWVSRRRRREIRAELRANLAAATEDVGPQEAVRQLGSLRKLADEYLETERGRVNLRAGIFAAVVVLSGMAFVWYVMTASFHLGFDAAREASRLRELGPVSFSGNPAFGAGSYGLDFPWYLWLGLLALAFVFGSRAWRLARRPS